MKHLLKILEVKHIRDGKVIWEAYNILNTMHLEGEQFILSTVFSSLAGISIPGFFYLGMDNRSTVAVTDNMQSLSTEPSGNGYSRQPVSSTSGFTVEQFTLPNDTSGIKHWRARTNVVTFSATNSSWGPVSNVFLTDRIDNFGYLISTAALGATRTVTPNDSLTFMFSMNIIDDPLV